MRQNEAGKTLLSRQDFQRVTHSLFHTKYDKVLYTINRHRTENTRGLSREKLMRGTGDTDYDNTSTWPKQQAMRSYTKHGSAMILPQDQGKSRT